MRLCKRFCGHAKERVKTLVKCHFGVLSFFFIQGHIGEALDEFHQAMRSAAEQQEIALICQYEIGQRVFMSVVWKL